MTDVLRMYASDPLYAAWDWLLTVRAAWINCIAYDLAGVGEGERAAEVKRLTEAMGEAFEELSKVERILRC